MISIWGLASSPWDCWLAQRGLATLAVRAATTSGNALAVAEALLSLAGVEKVRYPGLKDHPDHALAQRQFGEHCGSMVTFDLRGGLTAAQQFITATHATIPFCPSLGEVSTTLSHPASTSHRNQSPEAQAKLGITGGTIRLSVGLESPAYIIDALRAGVGQ